MPHDPVDHVELGVARLNIFVTFEVQYCPGNHPDRTKHDAAMVTAVMALTPPLDDVEWPLESEMEQQAAIARTVQWLAEGVTKNLGRVPGMAFVGYAGSEDQG